MSQAEYFCQRGNQWCIEMSKDRILVTGGLGFIGRNLASYVMQNFSTQVTVLDNLYRVSQQGFDYQLGGEKYSLVKGDIRNKDHARYALNGVETVFHLAALSSVATSEKNPCLTISTNVIGTSNLITAARESGVRKIVFLSSREVYGDPVALPVPETSSLRPKNIYGKSKLLGELICQFAKRNHGLDIRILRLSNVYGSGDQDRVIPNFINCTRKKKPLIVYGGKQILDFVWIEDVVRAIWQCSKILSWRGTVNIGTGVGTSILELAESIKRISNSESNIQIESPRRGDVSSYIADTNRLRTYLGWVPKPDLANHLSKLTVSPLSQDTPKYFG